MASPPAPSTACRLTDDVRANLHVGGRAEKAELTKRDHEICEAIGPALEEYGLLFTGIDVIGGYLTEINVTSPTGLQEINRFDDVTLERQIWDAIELKLADGPTTTRRWMS